MSLIRDLLEDGIDFVREERKKLCSQAIQKFGEECQLRQAQEEASELIKAISHYLRTDKGTKEDNRISLINEIADVKIMIEQLEQIFGPENVKVAEKVKLSHLKELINW